MNETELFGNIISPSTLEIKKAKRLLKYIISGVSYIRLVEIRQKKEEGTECIIIDLDIERPQRIEIEIKRTERLAIEFHIDDTSFPKVFSMREDFPLVSHLNLQLSEYPKSFCLYEEPYDVIKLTWTPSNFIGQIRNWLHKTSVAQLHEDEQALEPFILSNPFRLILPVDFEINKIQDINIYYIHDAPYLTFVCGPNCNIKESEYTAIGFKTPITQHGIIKYTPDNLYKLRNILAEINFDLDTEIKSSLKKMYLDEKTKHFLNRKALFIFSIPLSRSNLDVIERIDNYAFITCDKTLNDIGIEYGIFGQPINSSIKDIGLLFGETDSGDLKNISLYQIKIQYFLDAQTASLYNGVSFVSPNIALLGLGALGSQVANNFIRSGFGKWTLIDEDVFLPHNAARHLLSSEFVGYTKAKICRDILNSTIGEQLINNAICTNVITPSQNKEELSSALEESDFVFDFSASIAVSRFLASNNEFARSISAFLMPDGKSLIVAAEDKERHIKLDWLEMIHYREVINNSDLSNSLNTPSYHRYGNSCRDISVQLSQDDFAIWSGFASKKIRELISKENASLVIFYQLNYEVKQIEVDIYKTELLINSNWKIIFDDYIINKMAGIRKESLPNETGGILLGNCDSEHEKCYIVDIISAPKDSKEYPVSFIRGYEGLFDCVQDIEKRTLGQIKYIGEWHSHPNGCSVCPSNADIETFSWLESIMGIDSLPTLMMIIGENNTMSLMHSELKVSN
jgi:hypothetical protein